MKGFTMATLRCIAEVEVDTHEDLIGQYRMMPQEARELVGKWICKQITPKQVKRLPRELKRKLVTGREVEKVREDVAFLERLYRLEDRR
jgi:hypothetical protein